MNDSIIKEVRDARAAVGADFDFDLHNFFTWAKAHTAAERKAKHWLPTDQNKAQKATAGTTKAPAVVKRRVRRSGVPA